MIRELEKALKRKVPKVSIGLPVYNGEEFLKESIDSILSQSFNDFELIIADNASIDKTEEISKSYLNKDKRIRYVRNKRNLGAARNYNLVFELSVGKYFKWATHDDLHAPSSLERCVKVLDQNPSVVLCYSKTNMIDKYGRIIKPYSDKLHLQSSKPHKRLGELVKTLSLCNAIFGLMRANILRNTELIGSYLGSDEILLLELCLWGKFWEIPEGLFFRRERDNNVRKLSKLDAAKWFDPEYSGIHHNYVQTMLLFKRFAAIKRSSLSLTDKMLCYPQIGRYFIRKLRNIGGKCKLFIKLKMRDYSSYI